MFDPRNDIISLFTNSRIGAVSKYGGTASVYVKILRLEDNEEKEPDDYGTKTVGLLWLHPPRAYNQNIKAGTGTIQHDVVIDCHLIIPKNDNHLKDIHADYINTILNTFEATLEASSTSTAGKSWDVATPPNILTSTSDDPNIYYRMFEITCTKTN